MDFIVLSPPVCTPSEPPSGAFILASALSGHGFHTGFLDLSLEFYSRIFSKQQETSACSRSLDYLHNSYNGYEPMKHRTAAGALHTVLKQFSKTHPGWRLTAMDLDSPIHVHDPLAIKQYLDSNGDPFINLWESVLAPILETHRPKQILVSLAYLSQLTAAVSLIDFLKQHYVTPIIGGSLPRSLSQTGYGITALKNLCPNLDLTNGTSLIGENNSPDEFLNRLRYPHVLGEASYLSAKPVIPLTLSIGCFWRQCLFCPDKGLPFHRVSIDGISNFLDSVPKSIMAQKPVIHMLDSAMPPKQIHRFLPVATQYDITFYGFARPTPQLLAHNLLQKAADSGCVMLQLGVENANKQLLTRFNKGIDPAQSERVLQTAANAGIRTYVYLLFGLPGETETHRAQTHHFIEQNHTCVDFLNLSLFNLPKFCDLAERADEFGITLDRYPGDENTIQLYRPFTEGGTNPRNDARKFLDTDFLSDPKIRPIHLQTPRWFRAAHLALMNLPQRR